MSDIWRLRREEGVAWIAKQTGATPAAARNNDEVYASGALKSRSNERAAQRRSARAPIR